MHLQPFKLSIHGNGSGRSWRHLLMATQSAADTLPSSTKYLYLVLRVHFSLFLLLYKLFNSRHIILPCARLSIIIYFLDCGFGTKIVSQLKQHSLSSRCLTRMRSRAANVSRLRLISAEVAAISQARSIRNSEPMSIWQS